MGSPRSVRPGVSGGGTSRQRSGRFDIGDGVVKSCGPRVPRTWRFAEPGDRPPPEREGVTFSSYQTTLVPFEQAFVVRRGPLSRASPRRTTSRGVAMPTVDVSGMCPGCLANRQSPSAYLQALSVSPLTASNRRPPPYHAEVVATGGNQWQRFWLVCAVSRAFRVAIGCHWLHPRGSIKAPFRVICLGNAPVARSVVVSPQSGHEGRGGARIGTSFLSEGRLGGT